VRADTVDNAYAKTLMGIGGIIAGGGASSKAYAESTTTANINNNLIVIATGAIQVLANGTPESYARADGVAAGGATVGFLKQWQNPHPPSRPGSASRIP